MPVVFRWKNFKFFFFSNEGDPREPPHIHVRERAWDELDEDISVRGLLMGVDDQTKTHRVAV